MSNTLDVYRDWLKIPDENRPLSHYQLLRLKKFEDDIPKVREHYRKMNSHVRKYAAGEFAKQSQDLLNELAKAMLCLTDVKRKGEYDATMGRKQAGGGKARSFEELLLAGKIVDQAALEKARNFSKAIGVDVRDALVQQKLAKYDAVLPAYAESIGLPFLDLTDIPLDLTLIAQVPPAMARTHSCVPVMIDNNQLLMASPNPIDPNVEEELRMRFGMSVRTVLCTPANIDEVITKHVPRDGAGAPPPKPAGQAAPAAKGEAPAKTKEPKAPKDPAAPMTDEQKSQARNYAIIGAMLSGTATVFIGSYIGLSGYVYDPLGVLIAGVVFMLVYKFAPRA